VQIHWCPGHKNIKGNETADYYAKLAAKSSTKVLQIPLPINNLSLKLQKHHQETFQRRWNDGTKGSNVKEFIKDINNFNIIYDHRLIQIVTGHNRLNYYLQTIGVVNSSICKCRKEIEDVKHFMFECEIYEAEREQLIDVCKLLNITWPPTCHELMENPLLQYRTVNYLIETKRLDFQ